MKIPRSLTVLAASAALVLLGLTTGGTASAGASALAAPSNDSIDFATRLGTPPAVHVEDTSQATHSATDGPCVRGSSVWFRTRPGVTRTVRLSTIGSDYDTILAVFSGPKSKRTLLACTDDSFNTNLASARQVRFVAGTTYWVAVSACCSRRATGGQLTLNTWLPTKAGIAAPVVSVETGGVSGQLLVTGTVTCDTPSEYEIDLSASERVADGANVARGGNVVVGVCGPTTTPWSLLIDSDTGWAFQPGTARLTRTTQVYDGFDGAQIGPESSNVVVTTNPDARSPRLVR